MRWTASRWPEGHRHQKTVSFTVYRFLASIADEEKRFVAILTPPEGKARWTTDEASRRAGCHQGETHRDPPFRHRHGRTPRGSPTRRQVVRYLVAQLNSIESTLDLIDSTA
jgi:hypothetical protein